MKRPLSISLMPLIGFVAGVLFMTTRLTSFANMDSSELELVADRWQISYGIGLVVLVLLDLARRFLFGGKAH